jgi:hypothetical protein
MAGVLSEWNFLPIAELPGTALAWSTIVEADGRRKNSKHKTCALCDKHFCGGPAFIEQHIDRSVTPRNVAPCKPKAECLERYETVLAEFRRRRALKAPTTEEHAVVSRAEVVAAPAATTSTAAEDVMPVASSSSAGSSSSLSAGSSTTARAARTPEADEVTEAWIKALIKNGLSMDLFNDPSFRAAVAATATCGNALIPNGNLVLADSKKFTEVLLPAFDKELETKAKARVSSFIDTMGGLIVSEGWGTAQDQPIVYGLASCPFGSYFLKALDTSGETKDAQYIAGFVSELIEEVKPERITAVCMDSASKASFPLIEAAYPHLFCFVSPSGSIDQFLKDVCSSEATLTVEGQTGRLAWGENFLARPLADAWKVIQFVTSHPTALARYRAVAQKCLAESPEPLEGGFELIQPCETRFASLVMMLQRYRNVTECLEQLMIDAPYTTWLAGQTTVIAEEGAAVRAVVYSVPHHQAVDVALKLLSPILTLVRLSDGEKGGTLGCICGMIDEVEEVFSKPSIEGVPAGAAEKMLAIWRAHCTNFVTFHMRAACRFEPRHCRKPVSAATNDAVKRIFRLMATSEHGYADILADYADFTVDLAAGRHDLEDAVAFSPRMVDGIDSFKWANLFLARYKHLAYCVTRLLAISCSTSGCGNALSTQSWIHSKKRNRFGQNNLDRFVRAHTNLHLESLQENWQAHVLPWDIELLIEDPSPEDEGGSTVTSLFEL